MTVLLWRYWPPQCTEFDLILRIVSVFVLKVLFQHLLMFWTVVSAPEMIFSVIFEIMVVVFVTFLRSHAFLLKMFWTVVSAPEMIFFVIFEIMVVVFVTFLRRHACLLKIYKLCGGCDFDERDDENNHCFDNVLEDGNEDEE